MSLQATFQSMRPPFLVLTPACVLLGIASAGLSEPTLSALPIVLALVGAVSAHISVNTFNEYFDFKSGLDATTERTPFSGGSGSLVQTPAAASWVLASAVITLLLTVMIGLYFLISAGLAIVPIGLLGLVIIITYTSWLNRNPWLCLIAPGLSFGPLMVVGTQVALTGHLATTALWLSLPPFFLVNNLLLMNQLPDIDADRAAGRHHFPIAYGVAASIRLFGLQLLAAGIAVVLLPTAVGLSYWSLLGLLPWLAGVASFMGARQFGGQIEQLLPAMGMNVAAAVVTPAVIALALLLS
ncbi:prenyltransferase [Halioxenophilus sp. WMMB6]|uniref:prenyltransferase n=1 Tax=Halioxenophilus sp. WMMB6 TaxID=3073815 RepID=UPI00295F3202|nr:prenyltransferase [Halioxenophilus sp. WMMB6]